MKKEEFIERKELEQVTENIDKNVDAVIVEGYSDKEVLEKLGFEGKIFQSAEKTIEGLVEDVSRGSDKVAVLTDFDSHGKKQGKEITHELRKEVDVLESAREKFGKQLTSTGRRDVEDARPLFEDKEQKFVDAGLDQLFLGESRNEVDRVLETDPERIGENLPESYRNGLKTREGLNTRNTDYFVENTAGYDTGTGVELDDGLAETYIGLKVPDSMLSELVKLDRAT